MSGSDSVDSSSSESLSPKDELTWFVIKVTSIASLGGVLFGYDMGAISGALPQLTIAFDLSDNQQEWVVAILFLGGGFGAAVGGPLCDSIGRQRSIITTDVIFIFGATLLCTSTTLTQVLIGRFFVGIAVAVSGIADVSYLHELAPPTWRGAIVSVNEACISLGFLLAYVAGYIWSHQWRYIFGLAGLLAFVQLVGMWGMPESPIWLANQGRHKESRTALARIQNTGAVDCTDVSEEKPYRTKSQEELRQECHVRGDLSALRLTSTGDDMSETTSTATSRSGGGGGGSNYRPQWYDTIRGMSGELDDTEVDDIDNVDHSRQSTDSGNWFQQIYVTWRTYRKQIVITAFLAVTQQFCGQTNVLNYAPQIFTSSMEDGEEPSAWSTVAIGVVKFIVTGLVIWKIEVVGRRKLLLTGMAIVALGLLFLIVAFGGTETADVTQFASFKLALPGVLLVVCGYSMSFGPLTWLLTSELFPADVRGRALGASTIITYLSAAFVTSTFLSAQDAMGPSKVFGVYLVATLFGLVFAYLAIPDTAEKTADELEGELRRMPWWRYDHLHVPVQTELESANDSSTSTYELCQRDRAPLPSPRSTNGQQKGSQKIPAIV